MIASGFPEDTILFISMTHITYKEGAREAYETPSTRVININLHGNMMQSASSFSGTNTILNLGETETDAENAVWN